MMEEGRLVVAPTLDHERGNPMETERSPLLGVAGAVVYKATGTTKGDDIIPTDRPRIQLSHTRVLTIYCSLLVSSFPAS